MNNKIEAAIKALNDKHMSINALDKITREFFDKNPNESRDEFMTRWHEHKDRITAANTEKRIQDIELRIMKDNARRLVFDEVVPVALAILKKYHNKPYGEKTAEKISNECKAATGCALRLPRSNSWQDIDLTPLNDEGCTHYAFGYNDFEIYIKDKHPILNADNRIDSADIEPSDLRLHYCNEYCDNPRERAEKILSDLEALDKQYKQLESAIGAFNNLLPSGLERRRVEGFRAYF